MKFKIKIKDKEYQTEISEKDDLVKIKVGGKEFDFTKDKQKVVVAKTSFSRRDFSKKEIKAPISGTISGVFIKEGDFIKRGQKVFLLEAMKMENEIISEFEGKIEKISGQKGQKVKEGDILVELK